MMFRLLALGLLSLTLASPARAGTYTGTDILKEFNLVVLGDLTSSSEVEGRTLVGGNLKGSSSTYDTRALPASSYGALTVGGNIATSGYVQVNNSGNAAIAGNVTNMNMNGGKATIGGAITGNVNGTKVTGTPVAVPNFQPALSDLSNSLKGLAANGTVSVASNTATFSGVPDAAGQLVFNINDPSFFSNVSQISFSSGGASSIIINLNVSSANISANFLGGQATSMASKVIWNFYNATSLTFNTEFGGSVLALNAAVQNFNSIDGMLAAQSFVQNGEMHQYQYTGNVPAASGRVPEPAMLWIFAGGALVMFRRRYSGAFLDSAARGLR